MVNQLGHFGNAGELRTPGQLQPRSERQPSLPTSQWEILWKYLALFQRVPTSPQWRPTQQWTAGSSPGHSHTPGPDSFSTLPPSLSPPWKQLPGPHPGLCVQTKPKLRQRHADNFQGITDCYNDPSYTRLRSKKESNKVKKLKTKKKEAEARRAHTKTSCALGSKHTHGRCVCVCWIGFREKRHCIKN